MANKFAQSNGNHNAEIWYDAPTAGNAVAVPGVGDDAIANGKTVTIVANWNLDNLRNDNTGGATNGGKFQTSGAVTVTLSDGTGMVTAGSVGNDCLRVEPGGIVNGNGTGGSASGAHGIYAYISAKIRCPLATGTVDGGFGVVAINGCDVRIFAEAGGYPKSLDATIRTAYAPLDWLFQGLVTVPAAGEVLLDVVFGLDGSLLGTWDDTNIIPGNLKSGVTAGVGGAIVGTLIEGGAASSYATLAKEIGAQARGGSGTCAKLTPTSTTEWGYWHFYVPVTAATEFTLSFYHKIASGFNGLLKCSIYDTDQTTLKNISEAVSLTDDGDYYQFSATPVTPTATGYCLVRIEAIQGAHGISDAIYIDDVSSV